MKYHISSDRTIEDESLTNMSYKASNAKKIEPGYVILNPDENLTLVEGDIVYVIESPEICSSREPVL